jgi:hypothetical protein
VFRCQQQGFAEIGEARFIGMRNRIFPAKNPRKARSEPLDGIAGLGTMFGPDRFSRFGFFDK